ncbi:hypothetical protein [Halosimplex sp. TS25]|uniref:hypothetical protein n=1 Tax=Halosimplex rarum TaxID=3396619 RepID=UPI0039EA953C
MTDVDTAHDAERVSTDGSTAGRDPVPAVVDWLLALVAGAVGLVLTAVGIGLYTRVDRALITEFVTAEGVEVNGLTRAEAITAGVPFVDWFAVGIALTGLVFVVGAAAFVVARRRTRDCVARAGGTTATFWACGVYGAAITALVSFVPGSAVVGGGAAAYLHGDSETRVGAAAGLVGWALTLPLLVFLAVGLVAGAGAIGETAGGAVLAAIVVAGELLGLAVNAALGALGGFLVTKIA